MDEDDKGYLTPIQRIPIAPDHCCQKSCLHRQISLLLLLGLGVKSSLGLPDLDSLAQFGGFLHSYGISFLSLPLSSPNFLYNEQHYNVVHLWLLLPHSFKGLCNAERKECC